MTNIFVLNYYFTFIMNDSKLESLIELASVLAKQNNYQETLRLVAENASSLLKAETTLIMMINPQYP